MVGRKETRGRKGGEGRNERVGSEDVRGKGKGRGREDRRGRRGILRLAARGYWKEARGGRRGRRSRGRSSPCRSYAAEIPSHPNFRPSNHIFRAAADDGR